MKTVCLIVLVMAAMVTITTGVDNAIIDHRPGDVLIAYVDTRVSGSSTRIQNIISFLLPFQESDTDTANNITVGYVIYLLKETGFDTGKFLFSMLRDHPNVVAVIGIRSYKDVIMMSSITDHIHLPIFTFSQGILMDDLIMSLKYDYLIPITSSSKVQSQFVIPNLLDCLEANFINVVYDSYKERAFMTFFWYSANQIDVFETIKYETGSRTWLEYGYPERYKSVTDNPENMFRVFVVLLNSSNVRYFMEDLANSDIRNGIFICDSSSYELGLLPHQLSTLARRNIFIFRVLQDRYTSESFLSSLRNFDFVSYSTIRSMHKDKCSSYPCEGSSFSRYNGRIFFTVEKILAALSAAPYNLITTTKNRRFNDSITQPSQLGELVRTEFMKENVDLPQETGFLRFEGDVMYSTYDINVSVDDGILLSWNQNRYYDAMFHKAIKNISARIVAQTGDNPRFWCSGACPPGNKEVPNEFHRFCWMCQECEGNIICPFGNETVGQQCNSSVSFPFHANDNNTACDKPPRFISWAGVPGKILFVIIGVGLIVDAVTIISYIHFWNHKIIMASDRHISCIMITGITLGHILSITLAIPPSPTTCLVIQVLSHLFMMLTASPLLVKTIRVWLVFRFSVKFGPRLKRFVNIRAVLVALLLVMVPQIILLGVELSPKFQFGLQLTEEETRPIMVVTLLCGPSHFLVTYLSISYTLFVLVIATIAGFLCRKLPDNYKESLHIFVCSLISVILIATYVPTMIQLAGLNQVLSLAVIISLISSILNVIMFTPRVYMATITKEDTPKKNTYQAFKSHNTHVPHEDSCLS